MRLFSMTLLLKRHRTGAFLALTMLVCQSVSGVEPKLSNIIPRGGALGTDVEVRFTGKGLGDTVGLLFHDPGIELVEISEAGGGTVRCVLRIASDCRVGTHPIRVHTSTGISNLRLFSVGALTELKETEPNNDAASAQPIELGTTINGTIVNEDADFFSVELRAGDTLAVEIEALRLGGRLFDPKLRLFGPHGHELVSEDDTALMKQDAAFVYTAEESGRYSVAVTEASYGGSSNSYYRLHLGNFPRPLAVTPMGGVPGSTVMLRWLGDPSLTTSEIVLPDGGAGIETIQASNGSGIAPTPIPFLLSDWPGVSEIEPNDTRDAATEGTVPGAFDGVIQSRNDVDWYRFQGEKNQELRIRVWARELGSPLDSVLAVFGPSGSELVSDDDGAGIDSTARVTLPEDGAYLIRISDHLGRGGETFAYRIHAAPLTKRLSFSLPLVPRASWVVPRDNRTMIVLGVKRQNFSGKLSVEFLGLPEGLAVEHGEVPSGAGRIPVLLTAAADAPMGAALSSVRGTFRNESIEVSGGFSQSIPLVLGRNKTEFLTQGVERLALGVSEEAPYRIDAVVPKAPILHGGFANLRIVATRAEGFTSPIKLSLPWLPKGFGAGTATIPEGKNEAGVRVEVNSRTKVGEHRLIVMGKSGGYALSTAYIPIRVSEPWVTVAMEEVQCEQGKDFEWVGRIAVAHPFDETYTLVLSGLPKGVTAEPQDISRESTEIGFAVKVAPDAAVGHHKSIRMTATTQEAGETVRHGLRAASLKIYAPLPAKLRKPPPPAAPAVQAQQVQKPKRKTRFPEAR